MGIYLTAKSLSGTDVKLTEEDLKDKLGIDPYTIRLHIRDSKNRDIFAYADNAVDSIIVDGKTGDEENESIFSLTISEFSDNDENGFRSYLFNGLYSSRNPELDSLAEDDCAAAMINQGPRNIDDNSKKILFYEDYTVVPSHEEWGGEKTYDQLRKR